MNKFRRVLATVICERLVLKVGALSAEAQRHKHYILRTFLSRGTNLQLRSKILASLPNGDWRNMEQVEVYVGSGAANKEEHRSRSRRRTLLRDRRPEPYDVAAASMDQGRPCCRRLRVG